MFAPCEESLRQQHHQRLYEKMFFLFLSKLPEAFRRASTKENRLSWHCIPQIRLCWRRRSIWDLFPPALSWRLETVLGRNHDRSCNTVCLAFIPLTDIHFWMLLENRNVFWVIMATHVHLMMDSCHHLLSSLSKAWCNSPAEEVSPNGSNATLLVLTWASEMTNTDSDFHSKLWQEHYNMRSVRACGWKQTMASVLQEEIGSIFCSNQLSVGHCTICHVEGNAMPL